MKKCPFCAEEIQDEAIKCRYCGSFMSQAVNPPAAAAPAAVSVAPSPAVASQPAAPPAAAPPFARSGKIDPPARVVLYAGSPHWRSFFAEYFFVVLFALVVPFVGNWIALRFEASSMTRALAILVPLGIAAIAFFGINLYRTSKVYRVSNTNIENEYGIVSKKIDVIELWRCRDIRYRQNLADRILQVAHIDLFTADVTTPHLELVGMPATRELFEKLRDAIEIQRQARNVYGAIE